MGQGREFADLYNLESAKAIKPVLKDTKLILDFFKTKNLYSKNQFHLVLPFLPLFLSV